MELVMKYFRVYKGEKCVGKCKCNHPAVLAKWLEDDVYTAKEVTQQEYESPIPTT